MNSEHSIDDISQLVAEQGICSAIMNVEPGTIRDIPLQDMWFDAKRLLEEIQDYLNSGG